MAEKSKKHSIIGYPVYDSTVPAIRRDGRKVSNFFVSITTLTPDVRDSLCGFRIYPVAETWKIYRNPFISKRMPIDMELLTRLYWRGVSIIYLPVDVTYPENGSSHYKAFRDTVILSTKHAFLCCEMFFRFPVILFYAIKRRMHLWSIGQRYKKPAVMDSHWGCFFLSTIFYILNISRFCSNR